MTIEERLAEMDKQPQNYGGALLDLATQLAGLLREAAAWIGTEPCGLEAGKEMGDVERRVWALLDGGGGGDE